GTLVGLAYQAALPRPLASSPHRVRSRTRGFTSQELQPEHYEKWCGTPRTPFGSSCHWQSQTHSLKKMSAPTRRPTVDGFLNAVRLGHPTCDVRPSTRHRPASEVHSETFPCATRASSSRRAPSSMQLRRFPTRT